MYVFSAFAVCHFLCVLSTCESSPPAAFNVCPFSAWWLQREHLLSLLSTFASSPPVVYNLGFFCFYWVHVQLAEFHPCLFSTWLQCVYLPRLLSTLCSCPLHANYCRVSTRKISSLLCQHVVSQKSSTLCRYCIQVRDVSGSDSSQRCRFHQQACLPCSCAINISKCSINIDSHKWCFHSCVASINSRPRIPLPSQSPTVSYISKCFFKLCRRYQRVVLHVLSQYAWLP